MCRGSPAERILPNVGEPRKISGRLKFGWLRVLKASARNCSVALSANLVFFTSARFTVCSEGPVRMLRPEFPNVPNGGSANADVLNHMPGDGEESLGLPSTLGRSLAPKPRMDCPVLLLSSADRSATVNGRPDWNDRIPLVCQPPSQRWPRASGIS